jgi:hypothetical protein
MSLELVHARHLAQLSFLKQILDEEGLPTTLLEKSEEIPIHLLMAGVQQDQEGRDRFLHFSFLPLDEEEIQSTLLLQIYSTLPFAMEGNYREQIALLLLEINTRLPIGHIGMNENNEIHYRYVYTLSSSKTFQSDEILDVLSLFVYMLEMFGGVIEPVAKGTVDAAAAAASLR